ncbi:hypothetical protein N9F17_02240 [Salibacteraceae bacterium]|nr:hypothetical protein [Salibacteraceae bacterium]
MKTNRTLSELTYNEKDYISGIFLDLALKMELPAFEVMSSKERTEFVLSLLPKEDCKEWKELYHKAN